MKDLLQLVGVALMPPFCIVLLGTAGLLAWKRRPRLARCLLTATVVLLYAVSTPAVNGLALRLLEWKEPFDAASARGAGAIVVLGAGLYRDAPEYGGRDTVNRLTLERLRYAAAVHRQTGLPILTTGGLPGGATLTEADAMKSVLADEFQADVRWTERGAATTRENAVNSRATLAASGIDTVVLVTHAYHMRRSLTEFERAGFKVVPAATYFWVTDTWVTASGLLPSPSGIFNGYLVMHETLGMLWYALQSALSR